MQTECLYSRQSFHVKHAVSSAVYGVLQVVTKHHRLLRTLLNLSAISAVFVAELGYINDLK